MAYSSPIQTRARETEAAFLSAMSRLLANGRYEDCTIDDIAREANRHRGAFLKRFGSKDAAAKVLFDRFVADAKLSILEMEARLLDEDSIDAKSLMLMLSDRIELILLQHDAVTRSMPYLLLKSSHFLFALKRLVCDIARLLDHGRLVDRADRKILRRHSLFASRILVTLNYAFVAAACGAVQNRDRRHAFVASSAMSAWLGDIYMDAQAKQSSSRYQLSDKLVG